MGETDRARYDAMVSSIKNKFKIWTMRVNLKKSDGKFSTVSGKFHGIFPTNGFFLPMLDLTTNIDRKFSTVSGMISWIFPMVGFFSNNFIDWNFLNTSSIRMTVWKNGKFPMENVGRANLFLTENVENFWWKISDGKCSPDPISVLRKMYENFGCFLEGGKCSTTAFLEVENVQRTLSWKWEMFDSWNFSKTPFYAYWNIFQNQHSTCWNVFDSRTFTFLTIWHFQTLTF